MVVGVCRIVLGLPGNDSLKGKRKVVRRVIDRTRNRFNAAVAEVDGQDDLRRASIGVSVVSNESAHANSMLDTIGSFVQGLTDAMILERRNELIHIGDFGDEAPGTGDGG